MDNRAHQKVIKYYHTLKYLKLPQLYQQVLKRWHKPVIKREASPQLNPLIGKLRAMPAKHSKLIADQQIILLNEARDISEPDIWADAQQSTLWLYNLHYFDFIHADHAELAASLQIMLRWIHEVPFCQHLGWHPYPTSLRIVNWTKLFIKNSNIPQLLLENLFLQARWLNSNVEYHILGNHILANAKALLFAGLFFKDVESAAWLKKGMRLYTRELNRQILADGGHFELSPMYHSIILEDLLDIINLFACYKKTLPIDWENKVLPMLHWLQVMTHPDGEIGLFNDAAFQVAQTCRTLNHYTQQLGFKPVIELLPLTELPVSGYVRLRNMHFNLIADFADVMANYQPGHTHADSLTFELSINKTRFIVNSGTSTYAEGALRTFQRSTAAHNTVVIDQQNSSQIWKNFRLAARAQVIERTCAADAPTVTASAKHNGYLRSTGVMHHRTFNLQADMLIITDQLDGRKSHQIDLYMHIHPQFVFKRLHERAIIFEAPDVQLLMTANHDMQLVHDKYYPQFNQQIPNFYVLISEFVKLPTHFQTTIQWI